MNNAWIVIIVIVVCVCIQMGIDDDNKKKEARAKALMPEKLAKLLGEELREHASDFTQLRCEEAVDWYNSKAANRLLAPYRNFVGNWRTDSASLQGIAETYVQNIAPIFGPGVAAMAKADPQKFRSTFGKCWESATRLARAEAGVDS